MFYMFFGLSSHTPDCTSFYRFVESQQWITMKMIDQLSDNIINNPAL